MYKIDYILINDTHAESPTPATLSSIVPDFRHCHIVYGTGRTRQELIEHLTSVRQQWPKAKILGLSEIDGKGLRPSESMNALRRELSNYP